jgi:hypothetical protein
MKRAFSEEPSSSRRPVKRKEKTMIVCRTWASGKLETLMGEGTMQ